MISDKLSIRILKTGYRLTSVLVEERESVPTEETIPEKSMVNINN